MPATPKAKRIYLDYNATCPTLEVVEDAVLRALRVPGNPSSPHTEGREAKRVVEEARHQIGEAMGASALDLVFTSGGTEANHLGLIGLARASAASRVLLPATVHPSLWAAGESLQDKRLEAVPVDSQGRLELEALASMLAAGDVAVLGFSLANHEIGTIDQVDALAQLARAHQVLLFCDAVQALGRLPVQVTELAVDGLSISAHKIGGPKGVGALWLRPGPDVHPLIGGGKQEGGRRPGTQGVALIAGFAAAVADLPARLADRHRQAEIRDQLRTGLEAAGATLISPLDGLCNTVCARFPDIPGDLLVSSLDLQGVSISTGAACSSGTLEASRGLLGIGLSEACAQEAIRVSIGAATLADDIDVLLELLPAIVERAKRF